MNKPDYYYIMAFDTTTAAMQAEAYLKDQISIAVMPVPREISSGCGLSIRFQETDEAAIFQLLHNFPITGTLYKMQTIKVDGLHPIEKLMEF